MPIINNSNNIRLSNFSTGVSTAHSTPPTVTATTEDETKETFDKITTAIDSYLSHVASAAESPHLADISRSKELLEKLGENTERLVSLSETDTAHLLFNASAITKISSHVSKNLKNIVSGIKFTDEALIVSALIVQSVIIGRINQSLREHENLHKELSELILANPENVEFQTKLVELDLVLSHLKNTLHQTEDLSIHNWAQIVSASTEQAVDVIQSYLPSLTTLLPFEQTATLLSDIVVVAYAGHAIQTCHTKDLQLSTRQQKLEDLIAKEKDPVMQNFHKMELGVVNRNIEDTSIEMLRNCTILSVGMSIGAICAAHAGLIVAGATMANPLTWPLSVFASIVTVGVLGYQYRHEISLYAKLSQLYMTHYGAVSKHQQAVEDWEEQQSKTEIALNTSEIVKNIALDISNSMHELVREKSKVMNEMETTKNPVKIAYLGLKLLLLNQEETVLINDKNRRIQNVLDNHELYRAQLTDIQAKSEKLEAEIVKSSESLKGYVDEKNQFQKDYKNAKLGITSKKEPDTQALKKQSQELRQLRSLIVSKREAFGKSDHAEIEKEEMSKFFDKEIAQLDVEINSLAEAIKGSKNKRKILAEQQVILNYHKLRVDESAGEGSFNQRLEVILQQIKSSPKAKQKILNYLESRIHAVNRDLDHQQVRSYLEANFDENPKHFLTWMALQQHQHHFYSDVLISREMLDNVFGIGTQEEYSEGFHLAQPKAVVYLENRENRFRLSKFIIAMLSKENANFSNHANKIQELEKSLMDVLNSNDPLQQEALLKRYHLIDKYNRFPLQISQLLTPPAALEQQVANKIKAGQEKKKELSPNHLIDLAIFSLGISHKANS